MDNEIDYSECTLNEPKISHISGEQISFRRSKKVGATSKFWLKLTDVKHYCRKVGHLSTT